jgi:2-dehydro-3-deoxygluconokinase
VRSLLDLPETADLLHSLGDYDLVYLSAITLAIYSGKGRARLLAALRAARERGTRIVFDTNFRIRLWPDLDVARIVYAEAFETSDNVLASTEDLQLLFPGEDADALLARIPTAEAVLRLDEPASLVRAAGTTHTLRAEPAAAPVVDTTAAGDSFAAAYIAARLAGAGPVDAALAGHRLAGVVVCHPGAIIPREEMPSGATTTLRKVSR